MKFANLLIGLFIGIALGGAVTAATLEPKSSTSQAAPTDAEAIKKIVRETISEEPELIMQSVQKWQEKKMAEKNAGANEALKKPEVQASLTRDAAFIGPNDAKNVVVEFFDYNCPACKMQYKEIEKLAAARKDVKIVFKEYPIFGPSSDANAKIGLAVSRLYADKYFAFHGKMMSHEGRADENTALKYASDLGMDAEKIKKEAASSEVGDILTADRNLGQALQLQGTPTLVVNEEIVPHAVGSEELIRKLK